MYLSIYEQIENSTDSSTEPRNHLWVGLLALLPSLIPKKGYLSSFWEYSFALGQIVFLKEFISSTLDILAFHAILSQTEITVMTESEKKLAFVSFCIEEYKTLHGMDGRSVADLFEKYGVTDYLLEHYAILHSFSREAILNDIDHFMNVRMNEA